MSDRFSQFRSRQRDLETYREEYFRLATADPASVRGFPYPDGPQDFDPSVELCRLHASRAGLVADPPQDLTT